VTEYVAGRVEEALAHVGETDVHPSVDGDRLLLTGTVTTDERLRAVGDIAREHAEGLDVANEVTVLDCDEPASDLEETLP
jgi:hypothetical protein